MGIEPRTGGLSLEPGSANGRDKGEGTTVSTPLAAGGPGSGVHRQTPISRMLLGVCPCLAGFWVSARPDGTPASSGATGAPRPGTPSPLTPVLRSYCSRLPVFPVPLLLRCFLEQNLGSPAQAALPVSRARAFALRKLP